MPYNNNELLRSSYEAVTLEKARADPFWNAITVSVKDEENGDKKITVDMVLAADVVVTRRELSKIEGRKLGDCPLGVLLAERVEIDFAEFMAVMRFKVDDFFQRMDADVATETEGQSTDQDGGSKAQSKQA